MVNGVGLVGLTGAQLNVGYELAGQGVTLRMDSTQMAVISNDGELLRTCPAPSRPLTGTGCEAPDGPAAPHRRQPGLSRSSGASPSAAPSWSPDRRSRLA